MTPEQQAKDLERREWLEFQRCAILQALAKIALDPSVPPADRVRAAEIVLANRP